MKKLTLYILAGLLIVGFFIPVIEHVSRYNVTVTWTIREKNPTNHVITYDGKEFPILAGQEAIQTHNLHGGGNFYGFVEKRGWALNSAKLRLDGQEAHMYSLRQFKRSGTLRILGLGGSQPAMHVEIQM